MSPIIIHYIHIYQNDLKLKELLKLSQDILHLTNGSTNMIPLLFASLESMKSNYILYTVLYYLFYILFVHL